MSMRKLIASTFVSLDGVMQAPGGPEEDTSGGFPFGGWTFSYWDEATMDPTKDGFDSQGRDLVLGRRTYEIFEAHWPYQPADDPIAKSLNAARKHVASRALQQLHWQNSTLLQGDVAEAVAKLKSEAGPDLQIIGSGNLIQTLQAASLIDEFHVWTFPVVLGQGKRLFASGAKACGLKLVGTRTSATGVVMSTYVPAGDVPIGSFAAITPSARELERRKKWEREGG